MQKWEYRTITVTTKLGFGKAATIMRDTGIKGVDHELQAHTLRNPAGDADWVDILAEHFNNLGKRGWELVSSHTLPPGGGGKNIADHYYIFKRAVTTGDATAAGFDPEAADAIKVVPEDDAELCTCSTEDDDD